MNRLPRRGKFLPITTFETAPAQRRSDFDCPFNNLLRNQSVKICVIRGALLLRHCGEPSKTSFFILSKRFFGVPTFFQYAMADGIAHLLKKARTGIEKIKFKGKTVSSSGDFQLSLFPE